MRRFVRDESGMTMGLAVIMIVLIGVMGAGLLTFASRQLESVVEVNRGQRAMEAADAGLEAARRQLATGDARPSSYDAVVTSGNSPWYSAAPGTGGKTMSFNGDQIQVGIRYLTPSTSETEARQPDYAPEVLPSYGSDPCNDTNGDGVDDDINPASGNVDACEYPNKRHYFRVTVRGGAGSAVRMIQAIYRTENFTIPVGYFATRDIDFNGRGNTRVEDMSIFAYRNIYDFRADKIVGEDQAYGNWATNPTNGQPNAYNRTPRTNSAGASVTAAGAAALGSITYSQSQGGDSDLDQKCFTAREQTYGYRDYDGNSNVRPADPPCRSPGNPPLRPEMVLNSWDDPANQSSSQITFPFATGEAAASADEELLAELKAKAQAQGLYRRLAPGTTFTIDDNGRDTPTYPAFSDLTDTVMFLEFAGGTDDNPVYGAKGRVTYKVRSSDADNTAKGIIVVVNGDLDTSDSSDPFEGAMIVRDPNDNDNLSDTTSGVDCNTPSSPVMDFCNIGNVEINGYVNVEGDIRLGGSVGGFMPAELVNGLPGLFKIRLWSWRECYDTSCS